MIHELRCLVNVVRRSASRFTTRSVVPHEELRRRENGTVPFGRVLGRIAGAALVCLATTAFVYAQDPPLHFQHAVGLPTGAIGLQQLQRGGPLAGYFQPVAIRARKAL